MKKVILMWGLWVSLSQVMALPEHAVVKVASRSCDTELNAFVGSGLLFRVKNENFVLTSEHVVLHSNKNICHEVRNGYFGQKRAVLVAADWGMGLALLKVDEPLYVSIPELENIKISTDAETTQVTAFGYAYRSESLSKDNSGRILLAKSQRGLIPFVGNLIEVVGSFVEYGMSGGPVVAQGSDSFVGVLSHQSLKLVTSGPSEVVEIQEGSPLANDFFVIPAETVVNWIGKVMNSEKTEKTGVQIERSAELQLQGKDESVFTEGLQFTMAEGKGQGPIGGPEGAGRRREGGPVGGPEGAGRIGGAELGGSNSQVVITLDREEHTAEMSLPLRKNWFEAVRSRLLRQETLRVPYFVQFDTNRRTAKRIFFSSLAQFFTLLQNPHLTPITYIDQTQLQGGRASLEVIESLRKKSRAFSERLMKLQLSVKDGSSMDAFNLIEQLRLFTELLNSGDFEAVDLPWVKNLRSGRFEPGWQQLFGRNFDGTVDVIAELIQIIELIEKSRV